MERTKKKETKKKGFTDCLPNNFSMIKGILEPTFVALAFLKQNRKKLFLEIKLRDHFQKTKKNK